MAKAKNFLLVVCEPLSSDRISAYLCLLLATSVPCDELRQIISDCEIDIAWQVVPPVCTVQSVREI